MAVIANDAAVGTARRVERGRTEAAIAAVGVHAAVAREARVAGPPRRPADQVAAGAELSRRAIGVRIAFVVAAVVRAVVLRREAPAVVASRALGIAAAAAVARRASLG